MIRFTAILVVALALLTSAHADVVELLKAGLAARSRGDFDSAIYYYSQAIATGELSKLHLATVLNGRGVAYNIKEDPDKALADFDAAIQLKPDYGEAYINRGLARVQKRDYDGAIEDFLRANTLDAKFAHLAFNNLGIAYGEKRNFERAIASFDEAIRLRPDYSDAYYGRGNVYFEIEDNDKALADFDAAIRIKPNFQAAYTNRGGVYLAMGDIERAIADFDAAIRLDPKDGVAFSNRGYAHGMRADYDQAILNFTEAIRLNPYNSSMYLKRGLARFYSGYPAAAVQDFAAAVRLRPSDAYAVIWLHLARVRAGQDDGHELAQNAANIDRTKWPSPLVDLHLGTIEHDSIRASAISNHNSKAQRNRACEIEFYLATFDLEQGDRDEAQQHLRAAASTCPAGGIERAATYAELNGLR